jgi:hypothetical protein
LDNAPRRGGRTSSDGRGADLRGDGGGATSLPAETTAGPRDGDDAEPSATAGIAQGEEFGLGVGGADSVGERGGAYGMTGTADPSATADLVPAAVHRISDTGVGNASAAGSGATVAGCAFAGGAAGVPAAVSAEPTAPAPRGAS